MTASDNILIIVPEMVPRVQSWGGSQRMYYLANMLEKQGKSVITVSPGFETALECENKEVLYCPVYLGGNDERENKKGEENDPRKKEKKANSFLKKAKTSIYMFLVAVDYFIYSEPSSFQGIFYEKWLKDYEKAIWECIVQKEIKKIIISGPSFSLFSIAKKIKKKNGNIKIIFDYRDPWFLWKKRKNLAYLKEKRYLKYADCIVCFSEIFRQDMCKAFEIDINKTEVVYNGYSEETWEKVDENKRKNRTREKKLVITYVGGMDFNDNRKNYRNPNMIMRAVEKLEEGTVELKFVGVAAAEKMEKRNNINYIQKVTQEESFMYMLESDVLLNIHDTDDESGKYLVPGKFYDYMRSGQVIWNIGEEDGLAARLLKEYGLGVSCINRMDTVEEMLDKLIVLKERGEIKKLRRVGEKGILSFSREMQNAGYMRVLDRLR